MEDVGVGNFGCCEAQPLVQNTWLGNATWRRLLLLTLCAKCSLFDPSDVCFCLFLSVHWNKNPS